MRMIIGRTFAQLLVVMTTLLILSHEANGAALWRIINGMNARPHAYPSFVSTQRNGRHFCGGTLLNAYTVLTAAHCFFRDNANSLPSISVVAGEHDFNQNTGREVRVRVRSIILHPRYRSDDHWRNGDDIAIFKLQTPINENAYIKYARLQDVDNVPAGTVASLVGFGSVDNRAFRGATVLQEAKLVILSNADCGRTWPAVLRSNNANICFSNQGRTYGSCQGDSGGPAYIHTSQGVQIQVGITSYGSMPCSQPNYPMVYTRVSTYVPWIRQHL